MMPETLADQIREWSGLLEQAWLSATVSDDDRSAYLRLAETVSRVTQEMREALR